ncbi:MAG: GNAT family N-acetyltransferase [Chloroflexi bacterium]|nr:GNAT family N-acetyltransferase [Chloroflexota bacterium]
MSFSFQPALSFSLPALADLFTRGFEGYFVPVKITDMILQTMIRRDSVDLSESRVMLDGDAPVGLALIARRGWTSRLAAMGIASEARHSGLGTWAMTRLIEEARARGERQMLLEVIEQNTAGVKLYRKVGFQTLRWLVGFKLENPQVTADDALEEVDIRELARMVSAHGLTDLPWQLSGETIAQHTPPSRAFRLESAYVLVTNPEAEHVSIQSVLVLPEARGKSQARRILRAVFAKFSNKTWHVSPIFPEEMGAVFESVGMKREELSQWQMVLDL